MFTRGPVGLPHAGEDPCLGADLEQATGISRVPEAVPLHVRKWGWAGGHCGAEEGGGCAS